MNDTIGMLLAEKDRGGYLALDFDKVNLTTVKQSVKPIKLGEPIITKTSKGYHVMFLKDKLKWLQLTRLLVNIKNIDKDFKEYVLAKERIRIRIFGNDLKVIQKPNNLNFMERMYCKLIRG